MPPFMIAGIRAVAGGVILAGSAFFGQLAAGNSMKAAEISAGVAFFGYLVLRFGVEGTIDQLAANK